ncbi:hypothetical protein HKX48_009363 [Thoreauomyces humboldtii]|nr:hypothetical protein HKX48_009363 [Thoreauomyces humboldtii]
MSPSLPPVVSGPPWISLSAPKYIHASSKTSTQPHITTIPLTSLCSFMVLPFAWAFDHTLDYDTLADALAIVLQNNPVCSGRLVDTTNGILKIEFSNEGLPFAKGTSTLKLNELFPEFVQGGRQETKHAAFDQVFASPPLTIEETKRQRASLVTASLIALADQTSVLAVRFSHAVYDLTHVGLFMRDWADAVRGKGGGKGSDVDTAERDTRLALAAFTDPERWPSFDEDVTVPNSTAIFYPPATFLQATFESFTTRRFTYVEFHLPATLIESLHSQLKEQDPRLSKQDCISAIVLRSTMRSSSKKTNDTSTLVSSRLGFACDGRRHTTPSTPDARSSLQIPHSTRPIPHTASQTLLHLASQIRSSVLDVPRLHATVACSIQATMRNVGEGAFADLDLVGPDMICSQWYRAGLHAFDFGKGPPVRFAPVGRDGVVWPTVPRFAAVWEAGREVDGVGGFVVGVTLEEEDVEAFVKEMDRVVAGVAGDGYDSGSRPEPVQVNAVDGSVSTDEDFELV